MRVTDGRLLAHFEEVERVVADPLRFKLRLGIGEDAYKSLRFKKTAQELWEVGGAAATGAGVATSPLVATTFFASKGGFLALVGLGTATTPIGWAVAAAVASGGVYYGVTRLIRSYSESRVDTIPRFINTPIDVLGANLFDLIGALAVAVARIDGEFPESERAVIVGYFVGEWGFDPAYVEEALAVIVESTQGRTLIEVASTLAQFQVGSPDCNSKAMSADLVCFLREIAEADGVLDEREEMAIDRVEAILGSERRFSAGKTTRKVARLRSLAVQALSKWVPLRVKG